MGLPVQETEEEQTKHIDELQNKKTEICKSIVKQAASPRQAVLELMDTAIASPAALP